jgi:hypothetical protein
MNREKVRKRSREVPSPLLSVLIFASLGVVAVPYLLHISIRKRSHQNTVKSITNSISQSQE